MDYRAAFSPEISAMCHCPNKKNMTQEQIDEEVDLLEKCRPYEGKGYTSITQIYSICGKTMKEHILTLENLIINQPEDPKKIFWNTILSKRHRLLQELDEVVITERRTLWNLDGMRTTFAVAGLEAVSAKDKKAYEERYKLNMEGMMNRYHQLDSLLQAIDDIPNLKEIE